MQVCDRENTILIHDKGCKSFIKKKTYVEKMFEIKFDKRQNFYIKILIPLIEWKKYIYSFNLKFNRPF